MKSSLTLREFLDNVYETMIISIIQCGFEDSHRSFLIESVNRLRMKTSINPIADPISILYQIIKAEDKDVTKQAEYLGAFCLFFGLSADLFDDVQDQDFAGKHYETIDSAIILNCALTLLVLALDSLKNVMKIEENTQNVLRYFELFNQASLLAVKGQHKDLLTEKNRISSSEVLKIQIEKSSIALFSECAAIFADCNDEMLLKYRKIRENMIIIIQIVNDITDIYGKPFSSDVANGKSTYPLACFFENASSENILLYESLKKNLPESMKEIRNLLYGCGAIKKSAEKIEELRIEIHKELASIGKVSPYYRNIIFIVDSLANTVYEAKPLECSKFIQYPGKGWYKNVQDLIIKLHKNLSKFNPPPVPEFISWHQPLWLYEPKRKIIFYPDIDGQPEEVLPFQAELIGTNNLSYVKSLMEQQAALLSSHEFFHYWRDFSKTISQDSWFEELIVSRLSLAYIKEYHPEIIEQTKQLVMQIISNNNNLISEKEMAILEKYLKPSAEPSAEKSGYEISAKEVVLLQAKMTLKILENNPPLSELIEKFLLLP
ncbi:MAG: polyprenyl synthetase family protein [Clostridia bacterium]|nr:polyprenyl synthetase family protein [Clostridia bacterium]